MRGAAVVLVALAVASCGGGKAALQHEPAPAPRRATAPSDPCAVVPRGGDLSLHVLPQTPAVTVHVPDGLRAGERAPLVLGLHGAGQDARGFEGESNLSNVADEHHFVVAYPMSWRARGFWHYPEPDNPRSALRLLRATLDAVRRAACVDPGRVLVTGISSGGRMTYGAGCELADRILAIAPVSGGTRDLPPCHPARPISVLDIHGTSDQIVSYRGRGPDHDGRVPDVLADWAEREGCRPEPRERRIDPDVTRLDWPACRAGVRVAHLRIDGGRHAWPPLGGPPGIGIDGAEEIWRFFAALPDRASSSSHQPARRSSVSIAPVSSRSTPPWRLVKRPIVVVSRPVGADAPGYLVYFRLDRPLATRHDAVLVRLDGVSNYNTSGTGYDGSAGPHCYTKAIDNFKDFPRSLLKPRAAELVTVSLRFRRPPGNTITARVPLQIAGPADSPALVPSSGRLRTLGCST